MDYNNEKANLSRCFGLNEIITSDEVIKPSYSLSDLPSQDPCSSFEDSIPSCDLKARSTSLLTPDIVENQKEAKFKLFLETCIGTALKDMDDFADFKNCIKKIGQTIENFQSRSTVEEDTEDGLTLNQCIEEINVPGPSEPVNLENPEDFNSYNSVLNFDEKPKESDETIIDIKESVNIGQTTDRSRPMEEDDTEDGLTLTQCIDEINKPEPQRVSTDYQSSYSVVLNPTEVPIIGFEAINSNLKDRSNIVPTFGNSECRPMEEDDDENGLTLSQCIEEINRPEPMDSNLPIVDQNIDTNSLTSEKQIITDTEEIGINDAINDYDFKENTDLNVNPVCIKVKAESMDDQACDGQFSDLGLHAQKNRDELNGNVEYDSDEQLKTPARVIKPERARSSLKGKRRSSKLDSARKIEKSNHKITEYFPITAKSQNVPARLSKGKQIDEDSFILSALKGDANFCVLYKKTLTANYMKNHLITQHGISKDKLYSNRKLKMEDLDEELIEDTN